MAGFNLDLTRERTKAGLAAAAAKGRKGGRKVRFTDEVRVNAREMLLAGKDTADVGKALGFAKSTINKYLPAIMRQEEKPADE